MIITMTKEFIFFHKMRMRFSKITIKIYELPDHKVSVNRPKKKARITVAKRQNRVLVQLCE